MTFKLGVVTRVCGTYSGNIVRLASCMWVAMAVSAVPSAAQDVRYQPVNPSFGGNPLNSSHLQGVASAQNKFKDPDQLAAQDPAQQFLKALQSRIYSSVASKVTDALFGKNPVDTGQVVFGSQTVDFFRDVNGITLTVTDTLTGAVTNIAVPSYPTIN
jgi:curli production assembly/transport component CsgF